MTLRLIFLVERCALSKSTQQLPHNICGLRQIANKFRAGPEPQTSAVDDVKEENDPQFQKQETSQEEQVRLSDPLNIRT